MNYAISIFDALVVVALVTVTWIGLPAVVDGFRDRNPDRYKDLLVLAVILYVLGRLVGELAGSVL